MLEKIIIKNINSIDVCEIDFKSGNYKFLNENLFDNLINPVVIYGRNGSGKTAVMNAMSHFISMMSFPPESISPFIVNNFRFERYQIDKKNPEDIIGSIELFFTLNKDQYNYLLETSRDNFISHEYLKVNDKIYFEQKNNSYLYKNKKYSFQNKTTSKMIPFLRVLSSSEITDSVIQTVFTYIKSFTHVNVSRINQGGFVTSSLFSNTNIFDLLTSHSNETREIFKQYKTFPIYSIVKDNKVLPNGLMMQQYNFVLNDEDFEGKLPYQMISTGMQNQSVLLSLLLSMPEESVMFIDEADIALHPTIIKAFLDVLHQKKVQIVMTLHNTYAMQFMRPDQIYLAKWVKGYSSYYRLTKIYPNIREINNIEKMYLSLLFDEAINEQDK